LALDDFRAEFGEEFDYENLNEDQRAQYDELDHAAGDADSAF
jgi:hypothetical protein